MLTSQIITGCKVYTRAFFIADSKPPGFINTGINPGVNDKACKYSIAVSTDLERLTTQIQKEKSNGFQKWVEKRFENG